MDGMGGVIISRTYAPRPGAQAGECRAAEAGAGCAVDHHRRLFSSRLLPRDSRGAAWSGRRPRSRPQLQLQSLGLAVGRAAAADLGVPCMFIQVFTAVLLFVPANLEVKGLFIWTIQERVPPGASRDTSPCSPGASQHGAGQIITLSNSPHRRQSQNYAELQETTKAE